MKSALLKLSAFAVGFAVTAVVVFSGYMAVVYSSRESRHDKLRDRVARLERERDLAKVISTELDRTRAEVGDIEEELTALRRVLPCDVDVAEEAVVMLNIAEDLGIQVALIDTTIDIEEREFWTVKPFLVKVAGVQRQSLREFFSAIQASRPTRSVAHATLPFPQDSLVDASFNVFVLADKCPPE